MQCDSAPNTDSAIQTLIAENWTKVHTQHNYVISALKLGKLKVQLEAHVHCSSLTSYMYIRARECFGRIQMQ